MSTLVLGLNIAGLIVVLCLWCCSEFRLSEARAKINRLECIRDAYRDAEVRRLARPAITLLCGKHYFAGWDSKDPEQPWSIWRAAEALGLSKGGLFCCYTAEDATALMKQLDEAIDRAASSHAERAA